MSLFAELQRRSVFKVGAAYLVVAWLVIQAASIAFPTFEAPAWALRVFIFVVLLGFPIALVIAWAVELTPEGLKLDTAPTGNKRMFGIVAALAALAMAWYFVGQPSYRDGVAPHATDDRSIAVLPFANMSNDPEQEFFSDGIAEELLNRLAQFPDLKVAARTSAFQFKGKNLDVAEIGRQLKVAHVLEGSVRKSGTRLRITAQLIDSASGYHLWSQTYERDAADVFKVQDEISTAIANALQTKLGGPQAAVAPARTVVPAAYDAYLQGRGYFARRDGDNLTQAIAAYDRAIAIDPDYSAAHSGRAMAYAIRPFWNPAESLVESRRFARAAAERALELDPNNADGYAARAVINYVEFHADAARADIERATELAPGNVDVINFHGDFLGFFGDLRGAERLKRQAMALDPLAFIHPMNLAQILASQGRSDDSLQMAERAVAMDAGVVTRFYFALMLLEAGRHTDAAQATESFCRETPPELANFCDVARAALAMVTGRYEEGRAAIDALAAKRNAAGETWVSASNLAWLYSLDPRGIGQAAAQVERALEMPDLWLVRPLLERPGGAKLPEEISTDSRWLAAWNDPRFAELMAAYRANLAKFRQGG